MTLPRSETPLRRSAVGNYRASLARETPTMVNDDEAERREARRRTLMQQTPKENSTAESIEDNETIRACLEMHNGNKLSRENAWNLSLIDTLSNLLNRHHKSLSNFKVAGSSLEASSKVYGFRVDSIYLDAMRMSAGLNARKLTEQEMNAADDNDETGAAAAAADGNGNEDPAQQTENAAAKSKKKVRKAVSSVTKNKETLNARLDTAPLQDPVFGKLNSTVGSINASNRLMHNILPTHDSELRLGTNYRMWDGSDLPDDVNLTEAVQEANYAPEQLVNANCMRKLLGLEQQLVLRPLHTGYLISDEPNPIPSSAEEKEKDLPPEDDDDRHDNVDFYDNPKELSMVFDANAECEPMPDLEAQPAVLDLDFNDLEELTTEEQAALRPCRGLRKQQLVIDDLRPMDGTSKLDYSYRPMDKISQFWAGPSHWKFKRIRGRSTFGKTNAQGNGAASSSTTAAAANQRARRAEQRRSKPLNFGECHDELFLPLDANSKQRKGNLHKKWDARKLTLPTRHNFEPDYFFRYDYAPSIKVTRSFGVPDPVNEYGDDDDNDLDAHHADTPDDAELFDHEHFTPDTGNGAGGLNTSMAGADTDIEALPGNESCIGLSARQSNVGNDTVLEIASEFEGAPSQVTKVVVPFARRAKVIDMKNLKRSCNSLIQKQMLSAVDESEIPKHPTVQAEAYAKGVASFQQLYKELPSLLNAKMSDSLSPSVALYAVLHLANDMQLRLIPQDDLKDFKIRQVVDCSTNKQ